MSAVHDFRNQDNVYPLPARNRETYYFSRSIQRRDNPYQIQSTSDYLDEVVEVQEHEQPLLPTSSSGAAAPLTIALLVALVTLVATFASLLGVTILTNKPQVVVEHIASPIIAEPQVQTLKKDVEGTQQSAIPTETSAHLSLPHPILTNVEPSKSVGSEVLQTHSDTLIPDYEGVRLLTRADEKISFGDIASARNLLERGMRSRNNARIAFRLAETFDLSALKRWGVKGGIKSDIDRARELYLIALKGGVYEAATRLENIK